MESDLSVEQVWQTLAATLSVDNSMRTAAEAQLKLWESDAAPGFIGSLLKVAAEVNRVPEVSCMIWGGALCQLGAPTLEGISHTNNRSGFRTPGCLQWSLQRTRWAVPGARRWGAGSGAGFEVRAMGDDPVGHGHMQCSFMECARRTLSLGNTCSAYGVPVVLIPLPVPAAADDEKIFVRNASISVLLQDPSDRVALQAALLIANIALFDVPQPWETLLADLATASSLESPVPMHCKERALTALKYSLRGLRGGLNGGRGVGFAFELVHWAGLWKCKSLNCTATHCYGLRGNCGKGLTQCCTLYVQSSASSLTHPMALVPSHLKVRYPGPFAADASSLYLRLCMPLPPPPTHTPHTPPPTPPTAPICLAAELAQLSQQLDTQRSMLYQQEKSLMEPMRIQWERSMGSLLQQQSQVCNLAGLHDGPWQSVSVQSSMLSVVLSLWLLCRTGRHMGSSRWPAWRSVKAFNAAIEGHVGAELCQVELGHLHMSSFPAPEPFSAPLLHRCCANC
jgi:hypothetical protein